MSTTLQAEQNSNILYTQDTPDSVSQFVPMVSEEGGQITMSANGKGFTCSIDEWVQMAHKKNHIDAPFGQSEA